MVIAPPIIGTMGAGFVRNKPLVGGSLMAIGGIVMILLGVTALSRFGTLTAPFGFASVPPASFFIIGAVLGVMGRFQN